MNSGFGCKVRRSSHAWVLGLAVVAVMLVRCPQVVATLVIPSEFADMAATAQLAFAGTVTSIKSEWNTSHSTIVTRVEFREIATAKGPHKTTIEIVVAGGKVGNDEIIREGQPEFLKGRRYVLLCSSLDDLGSERNFYIPIVGLYEGFFPVLPSDRTGSPVVHDHIGREVAGVQDGKLIVIEAKSAAVNKSSAVRDLDYVVERVSYGKSDSLVERSKSFRSSQSVSDRRRVTRARQAKPDAVKPVHLTPDWVEGSQKVAFTSGPTVRVLSPASDPGTRMSEPEFLEQIRILGNRR